MLQKLEAKTNNKKKLDNTNKSSLDKVLYLLSNIKLFFMLCTIVFCEMCIFEDIINYDTFVTLKRSSQIFSTKT